MVTQSNQSDGDYNGTDQTCSNHFNITITGGLGNDTIKGGSCWDSIWGGYGDDWLGGGNGNDKIKGDAG